MFFPPVSSPVAFARRGRLLTLCCLVCLLASMIAHAQAPTAQMLWTQTHYTGIIAYSPTQPLIAAADGFDEIALLRPDGTVVQTIHNGTEAIALVSLAFAPDGQTLATGSNTFSVKFSTRCRENCVIDFSIARLVWENFTEKVLHSQQYNPATRTLAQASTQSQPALVNTMGLLVPALPGYE